MMIAAFLLTLASPEPPRDEVVVTGTRKREEAVLGSRVKRPREDVGNGQVSTATGVAGLTPTSGMDPFAGPTRRVKVKECRGDKPLAKAALCALAEVDALIAKGEFDQARAALFRIAEAPGSGPQERFAAAQFAYRIAELRKDATLREEALEAMLASEAMPASDRIAAHRSLVALALKRQDQAGAIDRLRRLVAEAPGDARSLANLAALHASRGEHEQARPFMASAVAALRSRGETPPSAWTDYLIGRPR